MQNTTTKQRNRRSASASVDIEVLAATKIRDGKTDQIFQTKDRVFVQGDPADSIFYIKSGTIKLTVNSKHGKEAVIGILSKGEFFGVGCLIGQQLRMANAIAFKDSEVIRLEKRAAIDLLHSNRKFTDLFLEQVVTRIVKVEEDLVDQLFNSSEKRLARVLLLLANFGKEHVPEPVIAKISQQTLADIVGTTRSRISFFMNKFRKLGFIEYNGGITIHNSLLSIVLHD